MNNTRTLAFASALFGLLSWILGAAFAFNALTNASDTPGPVSLAVLLACLVSGLLMMGFLALYVYYDAESRGMRGALWALLIFFFASLPGFLVYLLMRTPKLRHCPHCRAPVKEDYVVCPSCNTPVGLGCPGCGRRVEVEWSVCPYCQRALGGSAKAGSSGLA